MNQGKYGIKLWFYAVAAFVFALLELYIVVLALAAFAILAEKDVWLNRQVVQAIILFACYRLVKVGVAWLADLLFICNAFRAASSLKIAQSIVLQLVYGGYIALSVLAIINCIGGKDGLAVLGHITDKLFGDAGLDAKKEKKEEDIK